MLELVNDPDWVRFIGDRQVRTLEDARRYIESGPVAMYAELGIGMDLVALKDTHRPIGVCGLVKREGLDDVDLGFALLPEFRRQGYAFEAARATVRHGFEQLGFPRIAAIAAATNRRSIALLERLGFEFVRTVTFKDKDELLKLFVVSAKTWPLLERQR